MLSFSNIVQIRVNVSAAGSSGSAFSTGLILAPSASAVTEATRLRLFSSAADLLSAGFSSADPAYLAAAAYFAASPAPYRLYVGLYESSETPETVFRQILEQTNDFYGVCLCDPSEAKAKAFAEALPSVHGWFVAFFSAAGTVTEAASSSGILKKLSDLAYPRLMGIYGSDLYAAPAVMGTAMGLSRQYPKAPFSLCYQQVPGMLPSDLTESEIATLKALNANVYIVRGTSRKLLENGTVASGQRFYEVLDLDRISADLQEAALELITAGPGKLPQTDETSAAFINRFSAILAEYAAAGILAPGRWRGRATGNLQPGDMVENGYLLWADPYDLQTDADRYAHKAMPVHAALCLSGSVESLLINIDVTI